MAEEAANPVEQKAPAATTDAGAPAAEAAAPAADAKPADDAQPAAAEKDKEEDKPAATEDSAPEKPAADADVDMKGAAAESKEPEAAEEPEDSKSDAQTEADKPAADDKTAEMDQSEGAAPAADAVTPANKDKGRRKSGAASTSKKLNKKQSKAKIQHLDAKPGDHFFARLKGFPPWPVIVCDETMLPPNMMSSRPVTAARPDGTYREEFADGGKKAGDRTYPVMYLQTNEFSWTRNTDLEDLDPSVVADLVTAKMRKDLAQAHVLASEENNLDYYKQVLQDFEEARAADAEAKAARARAKKEKGTKKAEPKPDEDLDMPDVDIEEAEESDGKKSKKRKAEEDANVPQRSDSVKKPKIKLTTNTKPSANGTQSPKETASKPPKVKKGSKSKEGDSEKPKKEAPKEPELTPEEKQIRKEKEILFLRHRLQKGLLTKETAIKESDMQSMSDYLGKLEAFPDLEAGIIRKTKINKVLKAILKLGDIPRESELNFKPRSQTLLDKWNKILLADPAPDAAPGANGVNGDTASKSPANGVNGEAEASKETTEEKAEVKEEDKADAKAKSETKTTPASEEKPAEEATATAEPTAAESSA